MCDDSYMKWLLQLRAAKGASTSCWMMRCKLLPVETLVCTSNLTVRWEYWTSFWNYEQRYHHNYFMLIIFHHLLWVQQSDHSCLLLDHYLYSSSHKNPMVPSAIRTVRWLIIFLLSWLPFKSHFISTFIHNSVSVSVSITSSSTRSSGERKPAFHRRRY